MQELVIFTGNIGCGKSTMARKYAHRGYVVVNMDSITTMVHGGVYGLYNPKMKEIYKGAEHTFISSALVEGFSVVIDRTCMKRSDRLGYIETVCTFRKLPTGKNGVRIISMDWLSGNESGLQRRINNDRGITVDQWSKVHAAMQESYEKPTKDEGFDEIISAYHRFYFRAVDFDGTIVKDDFPNIGAPISDMIDKMREWEKDMGNITIVWTCRSGNLLNEARDFMLKNDIPFDFINENPMVEYDGSPKIFASEYYDDRNA